MTRRPEAGRTVGDTAAVAGPVEATGVGADTGPFDGDGDGDGDGDEGEGDGGTTPGSPGDDGAAGVTGPTALARCTEGARPLGPLTRAGEGDAADGVLVLGRAGALRAPAPAPAPTPDALRPTSGAAVGVGDPLGVRGAVSGDGARPGAGGPLRGSARRGTAGVRCTAGSGPANGRAPAGRSRPGAGRPEAVRAASPSTALDRPSSTVWEDVPRKDGFCHVGSRPLNRASATVARPSVMARWIGGSPDQDAGTTAPPLAEPSAAAA
ncbi:hypothetical protein ACIO93_22950 [Streptomyces sp. NPDC087903]|uniref:hypothetical protein n=1 Tax=Streptomyces sp. NPDC087903 TaxID=3365819 RepID=UPI0037FD3DB4